MTRPLILVDMDEVVALWRGMFKQRLESHLPHVEYIPHETIKDFYTETFYPEEHRGNILAMMNTPGFYRELEPIPGAVEGVHKLAEKYDVLFCSAPLLSHETCASEKLAWIGEHFGTEWMGKVVLTSDKTVVHGDVLIDDKENIEGLVKPSWYHVVFDAPYNQNSRSKLRVSNWDEVPGLLNTIFKIKDFNPWFPTQGANTR